MGVCEVVGGQNFWCDVFAVDTHILEDFHVRAKEEIFQIASAEARTIFC
jgi:hypothetical protein